MNKVLSIILAFLVLFSNLGLSMSTHYCMGQAVSTTITLNQQSTGCGMFAEPGAITKVDPMEVELSSIPCCQDELTILDTDSEYSSPSFNLSALTVPIAKGWQFATNLNFQANRAFRDFQYYSPPLLQSNYRVLYQVFRI